MTSAEFGRYVALGIGWLQVFANGVLLLRGLARLPKELVHEGATARVADLLRTAWVYGVLGNLCVSVTLLLVAPGLRTGEPLARQITAVIGVYYALVGVGTYLFAPSRHAALLVFSALGLALLVTLWLSRAG